MYMHNHFLFRLRAWFAQGNRTTWSVFLIFFLFLLIKTAIFHYAAFAYIHRWAARIAPVLMLSSLILFTKNKYWTIIVNILCDCWLISNLIYYKANGIFFSFDMIFMLNNMSGFWSSIFAYISWEVFAFPFLTLLYIILVSILSLWKTTQRRLYFIGALLCIISIGIMLQNNRRINRSYQCDTSDWTTYYVFNKQLVWENTGNLYVRSQSIISWLPAMLTFQLIQHFDKKQKQLTQQDQDIISTLLHGNESFFCPTQNLIVILVESFESWSLLPIGDFIFTPYLTRLIQSEHVAYANSVHSQIKYGVSADGQMLAITGLLPIDAGATCRLYGNNYFRTFVSSYPISSIVNPSRGTWEQSTMTQSYHFQQLVEPKHDASWNDADVMAHLLDWCMEQDTTFCALGITITSHVPFFYGNEHVVNSVPEMPSLMSAYLNCLHYTDSCIGVFVDSVMATSLANNTSIIITGDHTIFNTNTAFEDMNNYAIKNKIPFHAGHNFVPLIIYSPEIEGNIQVTDTCYQMDIFPTILHLIGAEDYYWHGFGVNLLDSAARNNRPCTEQEAYRLSDLIIRSDYFRTMEGKAE